MSGAVGRMIDRSGRTWIMKTWIEGATNAYNRTEKTLSDPIEIKGIRTETAKERVVIDSQGQERMLDVTLLIKDSVDVSDVEDTTKKSPLFISPEGFIYEAIALGREGNILDFHRIFLAKQKG